MGGSEGIEVNAYRTVKPSIPSCAPLATSCAVPSAAPGRADAPELPVTAERGGDHLLGLARLRADVLTNGHRALDDRVAEPAEALDLDFHDVPRLHGPRVGGCAGKDHVAWQQ